MKKVYLGIDMGSVSTKGVIIDINNKIIASAYLYNKNNYTYNLKDILKVLQEKININKYKIVGVGITGSKRWLVNTLLNANIVKNEIEAIATGVINKYPKVKTIFEIEEDAKIILINNKKIVDYKTDNLYVIGLGRLFSKDRQNIDDSQDNLYSIASRYLSITCKEKEIKEPIVILTDPTKKNLIRVLEEITGYRINTCDNYYLMGALGAAILSKGIKKKDFSFNMEEVLLEIETKEYLKEELIHK